jgi:hypothetical protein
MKPLLGLAALALLAGSVSTIPASAASTTLSMPCSTPIRNVVTCSLTGSGFTARERVYIVYRLTLAPGGTSVFLRTAVASSNGSFSRPAFRFSGDHNGLFQYRLHVDAIGAQGDEASITGYGTP